MRKCRKNRLKALLASDRGVTMVVALVVFLIAAMMSMVIVNAALGNIARLRRQYEKRQATLAMNSAEALVEDMIHGMSARKDKDGQWKVDFGKSDYFEGDSGKQLKEKLKGILTGTVTLKITSSVSENGENGSNAAPDPLATDVELKCNTGTDYSIEAKVKKTGASENDNDNIKTTTFPAITIEINGEFNNDDEEGERADTQNPSFVQW